MTKAELEALGLSETDVLDKLVERLLEKYGEDETGYVSDFEARMAKAVKEAVESKIAAAIEKHVLPRVAELVDGICLQETNTWGEKKGQPVTLTEYLVQRAEAYIREPVDFQGKTKEQDSWNWKAKTTRIAHMVHEHLQYSIDTAMKKVLGEANSNIRKGLEDAVKVALANITVQVKTEVKS